MQNLSSLPRKKFSFPVYLTTGNYEHIKRETQNYSPEWRQAEFTPQSQF